MSFTIKVKEELLGLGKKDKMELSAIIKMSGSLGISSQGLTLSVTTENAKIARHIYELLAAFYQVKSDIRHHQKANLRKNRVYTVFLYEGVEQILADLHLADSFFGIEAGIDQAILSDDEASRSHLLFPYREEHLPEVHGPDLHSHIPDHIRHVQSHMSLL